MEPDPTRGRRRELRFMIEAGATVEVVKCGQTFRATTVNMSGCGVLLHFEKPAVLVVGDEVVCEFKIEDDVEETLPYWGVGTVVRIADLDVAIDIKGGGFSRLDSATGVATPARI
ncbi:MAG: PilZ domain-containing protein [Terriglobales bacterium]